MTTVILHNNVIGTSYQHSRWDVSRMRATRKLIVHSDRSDIEDVNASATETDTVIAELTAVTGSAGSFTTLIGPLWLDPNEDSSAQLNTYEIVHPDNNTLPLRS